MAVLSTSDSFRILVEAGRILAESPEPESALPALVRLLVPRLADWGAIHLQGEDGELRRYAVAHPDTETARLAARLQGLAPARRDGDRGIARAVRTGEPELIAEIRDADLEQEARSPEHLDALRALGLRSSIIVPLKSRGRLLGVATLVLTGSDRAFDADDLALAAELGRRIAAAVDGARLGREADRRAQDLARAEGELRRLRELMGSALGVTDVAVTAIEPSGGMLFANDAQARLLGFADIAELLATPREAVASRVELFHEDGRPILPEEYATSLALRGTPVRHRVMRVRQRSDGSERWYECHASPVMDGSGELRFVVTDAHDITRLKRTEEALRKSETLYRAVTENSPQLAWMSDDAGKSLFYNRQWGEYTGRPIRAGEETSNLDILHPDDVPAIAATRKRSIPDGQPYTLEFRVRRADGAWRWHLGRVAPVVGADGRLEYWFGSATDVHDLRLAQESLRQSEEEFRVMFELAGSGKMQVDPATGRLLRVNRKFCGIAGRTEAELLAMTYPELAFAENRAGVEALLAEIRSGKRRDWYEETRFARQDGTLRWVQVTGTVLSGQHGRPDRLLATVHDVTERKMAEEEARSAQEKFRQSQKLESIGRLAGGVAHDFNNLLTAINGYSDLLLLRMDPSADEVGYVKEIRQSGERAAVLTRQLLAYSRRQMMSLKVVDLNGVVARIASMLGRLLGEPIRLETDLDPALPRVKVDAGQFEQVILNLAINARDAMPDGGTLVLRTALARHAAPVEAHEATVPAGAYVHLEVEDTGHGMEKEVLARLFEPFFTTKEVGKGTGLGLSMVQGIVRQSEGYIRVESAPKEGTRFTILLPAVESREALPAGDDAAPSLPGPAGDGATVLLVEDEDAVRRYAREILSRSGYRVLEASGGEEALDLAERQDGPIHLLLSDVVMPGMTGPKLAEALAAVRPRMRVLFMSGYSDASILRYGIMDANRDFLQKPFSPADLLSKAREILLRQTA